MQINATRNDLYGMEQDIIRMRKDQHTLSLLLRKPIADFFNYNEQELKITNARFKSILDEFVEKDEHGKMLQHVVNGTNKWKFRGSYQAEDGVFILGQDNVEAQFNAKVHKLMSQPIIINI